MARSSCPNCGAPVELAYDVDANLVVPLETHTDASSDAPRYKVIAVRGGSANVRRVSMAAVGEYQPDHRYDCPAHHAGRR